MHTIENNTLRIQLSGQGAELQSIFSKKHELEYLWQADATYWPRHAPVLFPIVGKLKDDTYLHQGKSYRLGQHGFARDKAFSCVHQSPKAVVFELKEDADTLSRYPFPFRLRVAYSLQGEALAIGYEVENTGQDAMWFSIGGHPGFRCPLMPQEAFSDYYLEFSQEENISRLLLENGLFSGEKEPLLNGSQTLPFSHGLFAKDALVLDGLQSDTISLKSRKGNHGLHFHFHEFPYLGIWSKGDAPFVCIEPWYGLADYMDTSKKLEEKRGIRQLAPAAKFQCRYSIDFF